MVIRFQINKLGNFYTTESFVLKQKGIMTFLIVNLDDEETDFLQ